ncbi:MAG: calcium/sodium antiporter [Ostreibacterium sp.]
MLLDIIYIIASLVILVWSADKFIEGAAGAATYCGMPPLLVGILIVGFGTSAPEIFVSVFAAANGNPEIALGNAYGSNITNIGLVLGITALCYPLAVSARIIRRELPLLVLALLLSLLFFYGGKLNRIEAIIMLIIMVGILLFTIFYNTEEKGLAEEFSKTQESDCPKTSLIQSLLWLLIGLALLLLSSKYLVDSAVNIAKVLGVSDLVIGLTVIAIGTSLPELVTSLVAAKKGQSDIVFGNIIGSSLFNALVVTSIAGVIQPIPITNIFLQRDFITTIVLTLLLWILTFATRTSAKMNKKEGGLLLLTYLGYTTYLLLTLKG